MTPSDHDLPPDDGRDDLDPDELAVHAVLDGEADAEQRRRVARDPVLVARVAELRAVADAVGADVAPPAGDVLAGLRARALAAATSEPDHAPVDAVDLAKDDTDAPLAPGSPPDDPDAAPLGSGGATDELADRRVRRRRARGLPPLPAVAAVVVLLALFGAALILTDRSSSEDADTAASAPEAGADADTGAAAGAEEAQDGSLSSPQAQFRAEAATSYTDEEQLLDALRTVDPASLDLSGTGQPVDDEAFASSGDAAEDEGSESTTADTADESGDAPPSTTTPAAAATITVTDPRVQRCDTVLQSTAPNIGPATAATIVLVDDIPVLVLSNPVAATDDEEASIRLSTFDAVSCVPGDAVQR